MRTNQHHYQMTINHSQSNRSQINQRLSYLQQAETRNFGYFYPITQKENNIRDNNTSKYSLNTPETLYAKSTTSTQQQTHPKGSTDNLHALRLESQILQLQKTVDQQQYEIQTLSEEGSHYMKLCEQQKQVLLSLNIEGMKSQYQQQIKQLLQQRQKIEEIIIQLQDDYNEIYEKEQNQLNYLREKNNQISKMIEKELERKKSILTLLKERQEEFMNYELQERQSQQRLDEQRNIERKLNIAIKQLQMLRNEPTNKQCKRWKGLQKIAQADVQKQGGLDQGEGSGNESTCKKKQAGTITNKNKLKYEYLINEQ